MVRGWLRGMKHATEVRRASVFELTWRGWRRKGRGKVPRRFGLVRRGYEWFALCSCGWEGKRRRGKGAFDECVDEAKDHRPRRRRR